MSWGSMVIQQHVLSILMALVCDGKVISADCHWFKLFMDCSFNSVVLD